MSPVERDAGASAGTADGWLCLQENAELFRADVASQSWKHYVNYIDNVVLGEFDGFVRKSLNYLMDNMVMDVSCTRSYTRAQVCACRACRCETGSRGHRSLPCPDGRPGCPSLCKQTEYNLQGDRPGRCAPDPPPAPALRISGHLKSAVREKGRRTRETCPPLCPGTAAPTL